MSVYAVTGAAGYIGQGLIKSLDSLEACTRILATDNREPREKSGKMSFLKADVRDRGLLRFFSEGRVDCLIHLAFIVNPSHNEKEMYDINVNGTANILNICEKLKTGHVIAISSASAYGAYSGNREFLREEDPVRGFPESFSYAHHKGVNEGLFRKFVERNPEVLFNVIRPAIVYGPNVNNYLSRFWKRMPFVFLLDGNDVPWQFVHEDDVVFFISRLLEAKIPGAFNVAPEDTVRYSEIAEMIGKGVVRVPLRLARLLAGPLWKLRLLEMPAGALDYTAYPWTVDSSKSVTVPGFHYRYSSRETLRIMMESHGFRLVR